MSIHEVIRNGKKKHVVKLRRPDGTQYSRTFRTNRDAKAFEASEIQARNKGVWIDNRLSAITFGALAELWLKQNPDKRQRTLERDVAILKKHVLPTLGDQPILSIKHSHIQTLVNTWSKGDLKPRTIQRQIAVMKAVFQRAVNDDLIVKSPIKSLRVPKASPVGTSSFKCRRSSTHPERCGALLQTSDVHLLDNRNEVVRTCRTTNS